MDRVEKVFEARTDDGWWIASTRDVDRQMDIVEPRGLMLDNYRKNNVLLWAHDYGSPFAVLGKADELEVTDSEVRVRPSWREPVNDSDPMHIIRALIDQGLLRALSIGFRPIEAVDNPYGGRTFTRAELLEISVVPVPAQQNAVREALAHVVKALAAPETVQTVDRPDASADAPDPLLAVETDGGLELTIPAAGQTVDEGAQGQTPEATAATVAADADDLTPEEQAALASALAMMLASVLDYLGED